MACSEHIPAGQRPHRADRGPAATGPGWWSFRHRVCALGRHWPSSRYARRPPYRQLGEVVPDKPPVAAGRRAEPGARRRRSWRRRPGRRPAHPDAGAATLQGCRICGRAGHRCAGGSRRRSGWSRRSWGAAGRSRPYPAPAASPPPVTGSAAGLAVRCDGRPVFPGLRSDGHRPGLLNLRHRPDLGGQPDSSSLIPLQQPRELLPERPPGHRQSRHASRRTRTSSTTGRPSTGTSATVRSHHPWTWAVPTAQSGQGTGTLRLRARTRISSPSSVTSSMTRPDRSEKTTSTGLSPSITPQRDGLTPSATTETATEPKLRQSR